MSKEIGPYSEITKRDLAKGRNLAIAAAASPFVLGGFPLVLFFAPYLQLNSVHSAMTFQRDFNNRLGSPQIWGMALTTLAEGLYGPNFARDRKS